MVAEVSSLADLWVRTTQAKASICSGVIGVKHLAGEHPVDAIANGDCRCAPGETIPACRSCAEERELFSSSWKDIFKAQLQPYDAVML